MGQQNPLPMALLVIVVIIALFFLFRQVTLWYFRINDLVKNQETQIRLMKSQINLLEDIQTQTKGKIEEVIKTQEEKPIEDKGIES